MGIYTIFVDKWAIIKLEYFELVQDKKVKHGHYSCGLFFIKKINISKNIFHSLY